MNHKLEYSEEAKMKRILSRGIKDIITGHPAVGEVLSSKGISCVTCAAGTCALKDIVEVHGLTAQEEQDLFARVAEIVFPGEAVEIPQTRRNTDAPKGALRYSPPMQSLVDEHTVIKRMLALIPVLAGTLDFAREEDRATALGVLDFIRSYADKFHHAKEEDILFGLFPGDLAILTSMREDHTIGRGHVKAALQALEEKHTQKFAARLLAYRELLREHIRKEDELLYPWMDKQLSVSKVGELFSSFAATDERFKYTASRHEAFVRKMEETINMYKEVPANV
jgi:hemerythrin-like domain-containing protein